MGYKGEQCAVVRPNNNDAVASCATSCTKKCLEKQREAESKASAAWISYEKCQDGCFSSCTSEVKVKSICSIDPPIAKALQIGDKLDSSKKQALRKVKENSQATL